MKKLIAVFPLLMILVGCNQAAAPGDPSEITARAAEWDAALNGKDVGGRTLKVNEAQAREERGGGGGGGGGGRRY